MNENYKKKPMTELANSINMVSIGDLEAASRTGCISKIIALIVIIISLFMVSRCSI